MRTIYKKIEEHNEFMNVSLNIISGIMLLFGFLVTIGLIYLIFV